MIDNFIIIDLLKCFLLSRFVEKYLELLQTDTPRGNLFEATAAQLREEGLRLRRSDELEESTMVIL